MPRTRANVLDSVVLATPGTPSRSTWPPASRAIRNWCVTAFHADDDPADLGHRAVAQGAQLAGCLADRSPVRICNVYAHKLPTRAQGAAFPGFCLNQIRTQLPEFLFQPGQAFRGYSPRTCAVGQMPQAAYLLAATPARPPAAVGASVGDAFSSQARSYDLIEFDTNKPACRFQKIALPQQSPLPLLIKFQRGYRSPGSIFEQRRPGLEVMARLTQPAQPVEAGAQRQDHDQARAGPCRGPGPRSNPASAD